MLTRYSSRVRCSWSQRQSPGIVGRPTSLHAAHRSNLVPLAHMSTIFEVAAGMQQLQGPDVERLRNIFRITSGVAACTVGEELGVKYGMQHNNQQLVVSVSNVWSLEQTWFNTARTRKPQTFLPTVMSSAAASADPTGGGGDGCDFCRPHTHTAADPGFGRVELPHAVTGSNLFKITEPCHGLVMFRHHDPLSFSLEQLSDMLTASSEWFRLSACTQLQQQQQALVGLQAWNSQVGAAYGSSAPLPVSSEPTPASHGFVSDVRAYVADVATAVTTGADGLHVAGITLGGGRKEEGMAPTPVVAEASSPSATLEVGSAAAPPQAVSGATPHLHPFFLWNCLPRAGASQYHGHAQVMLSSVALPAQQRLDAIAAAYSAYHVGLDGGAAVVGGYYTDLLRAHRAVGLLRTCGVHRDRAWAFANLAPVKDMEMFVMGSHLTSPAFIRMLHAALRALIDSLGATSFNVGIFNINLDTLGKEGALASPAHTTAAAAAVSGASPGNVGANSHLLDDADIALGVGTSSGGPGTLLPKQPIMVRIVTRGAVGAPASDFGTLEVLGGASIGRTDPFLVIRALDVQLGVHSRDPLDGLPS